MSIFSALFIFISDLFNPLKKLWDKLPASVQTGITNGSGIFHILSQYVGQDVKLTIATIQANYPTENLDQLYNGLSAVAKTWGITVPATLEELVIAIQSRIAALDNTEWARVLSGAAQILADFLSGAETPFELIVTVIQWVFTNIVQKKQITLVSLPPGQNGAAPLQ